LRTLIPTLLLVLGLLASACGDSIDHLARAEAIERELLRQTPDAGYEHHRYVLVLRELNRVPLRSSHRDEADGMSQRIMDGRRLALVNTMPQVDHLPRRLEGTEAATPPRPRAPAARPPTSKRPPTPSIELSDADRSKLDIVLYSTSWCGYCRKARSWMTSNGVPFVEKDIEKDAAANAEYKSKSNGYSGVPLIDVNGTVVRGFDQPKVQGLISKALRDG
jgi:glutaredoxin